MAPLSIQGQGATNDIYIFILIKSEIWINFVCGLSIVLNEYILMNSCTYQSIYVFGNKLWAPSAVPLRISRSPDPTLGTAVFALRGDYWFDIAQYKNTFIEW